MKSKIIKVENYCGGEEECLLCPECGEYYTHLETVEEYLEGDGRKCVKLHFSCEFGHTFDIDFHQHEGITFLNRRFS